MKSFYLVLVILGAKVVVSFRIICVMLLAPCGTVFVGSSFGMNWMKITMYVVMAATI